MRTRILFTLVALLALSAGRLHAQEDVVTTSTLTLKDAQGNSIQYTLYTNETNPAASYAEVKGATLVDNAQVELPATVSQDATEYPVTGIAKEAFKNKDNLQSLLLGKHVRTIGEQACYDCDALVSVGFAEATGIPEGVIIANYAFYSCDQLATVNLPCTQTSIGDNAFRDNRMLTTFTGLRDAEIIGSTAFLNCEKLTLGSVNTETEVSFKTIGSSAFAGCSSLGSLYLRHATSIGNYAFQQCTAMKAIHLGNDLVSLGTRAFSNCSSVRTIDCGSGLQTIDYWAFEYCTSATEASLPAALTNIGSDIFRYCGKQLDRITFNGPADFTYSGSLGLDAGALILVPGEFLEDYKAHSLLTNHRVVNKDVSHEANITLTESGILAEVIENHMRLQPGNVLDLTLSGYINGTDIDYLHGKMTNINTLDLSGVTIVAGGDSYHRWSISSSGVATKNTSYSYNSEENIIGDYMFQGLPFLKSICLPNTATAMGNYAVAQCGKLTYAGLPQDLQTIGDYAFYNNKLLATADLPEGVTSIGQQAFYGCDLREVYFPPALTDIKYYAFGDNNNLVRVTFVGGCSITALPSYAFAGDDNLQEVLEVPSTVTTIGNAAFAYCKKLEQVTFAEGGSKVKVLGNEALRDCNKLQSFPIGTELTTIGEYAFCNCYLLTEMHLPASVTSIGSQAFIHMTALESATLPASITKLPQSLFEDCSALANLTLQGSITSIGESCFERCSALTKLDANAISEVTTLGDYAFLNSGLTTFPALSKVTSLGFCSFGGCNNLKELDLRHYAITSLPARTAMNCAALETVWLPAGVQTLDYGVFEGCKSLTDIRNTSALQSIGDYAFSGCEALTYESFETALDHLTRINYEAFRDCKSLTEFPIPATLTTMGTSVFRGSGLVRADLREVAIKTLPAYTFYECGALKEVQLYPNLTTIGSYAFYKCATLDTLNIPATVTSIDQYAFSNTALRYISLSDSMTTLGQYAFENCDSLRYVNLGRNLNYPTAFSYLYGCDNVETLRIYAGTVPSDMSSYYVLFRSKCVLEVPMGTVELYQAASIWKEFKEIRGFLTGDKLAPEDYAVLKDLYNNLDGENWTKTWDLSTDDRYPGKWYGVTTEGDHITAINLNRNGLAGTLPGSVFTLPELLTLDLSHNAIEGQLDTILPEESFNSKMATLYLTNNHLTGDLSPLLARLPNLTTCYLDYNQLTGMSEEAPKNLTTSSANFYTCNQFWDYDAKQLILRPDLLPVEELNVGVDLPLTLNSLQDRWRVSYKTYMNAYNAGYSSPIIDSKTALLITDEDMLQPHPGYENHFKNESIMWFGTPNNGSGSHTQVKPYYVRFLEGDVNADRLIDVTDLVSLTNYLSKGYVQNDVVFNFSAADGEGNDTLDVRDIVMDVNHILAAEAAPEASLSRAYNIKETALPEVTLHMADGRLYLTTETDARLCALQIDLRGVDNPADILPSKAAQGKNIATARTADGCVRVVIYSNNGATFAEGTNALLRGLPEGAYVVRAIGADSDARRLMVNTNGETTGLNATENDEEADAKIYDPSGRLLRHENAHGVIIVNGKKQYRK